MAGLLDLPAELILAIGDYLQMGTRQIPLPFHELGDAYRYAIERDPPPSSKSLHSFLLATCRLNSLLQPLFYRDIFVRRYGHVGAPSPLQQLNRSLEKDPGLQEHIISAIIPCDDSIYDIHHFFWFSNIRDLTIHKFSDWEPLEFPNNSHIGTSPVECLKLIDCGAHEGALAAVLSWPASLKTLHYDAEQGEWEGHIGDEPAKTWTCAAFVRTLQPQKTTLVELTMTRPPLVHEGLGNGPRIDLSEFMALRILRIYHVFLCGWDAPHGVWKGLPHSLEVLEIFYDDTELTEFLSETDNLEHDNFMLDLIQHKRVHLPYLHTVNIYSTETVPNSETEEDVLEGSWRLAPSLLAREAKSAGVKLKVWLGYGDNQDFEKPTFSSH
ncbi:hypothetical protein DTO013E5_4272 [Penicillium roqueforti]|uniref:F-box domain, cyclin-like n=1 Tax=Penicillium roqueforti (strain FM164) TaxID=1365484 RepID=W6PYQ1_PENRF|nr:uncharacterized protein LCP9604111_4294 [Penicillium roqueforti]CDM27089.1 hypothetical protein PROQFM164_S01g000898 [Penicillium roqueforti FM164]KAF9249665.1 hypothetical protein LCP9604111_4294 [Penicillium roqueforti]KAI1835208.1 hypothetical protein CBS147337_4025 [Penicillium roqueforti]KAI2677221.1 hypothetical protein CBS147355_5448 [Penicillium roqueforti]KAI2688482.1 hypothetical protein LCP963914a_2884 [Penicillium roqueforti]